MKRKRVWQISGERRMNSGSSQRFRWVVILLLACLVVLLAGPNLLMSQEAKTKDALVDRLRPLTTTIRGEQLRVNLLLRAIGRKAGVNIVVDEAIAGTISLDLGNVNLYDLFKLVLDTNKLDFYEANNALVVEKAEQIRKNQRDVVTLRLCPRFSEAKAHVSELELLKSPEGSLTVSADNKCVVVRDHLSQVERIKELLAELDHPIPQVHIRARIVTIDKSISKELGVKWGYTDLENLPQDSLTAAADLSVADPASSIVFGFIRDTFTLDLELSALQERNQLKILSEPRVVVLDGQEAEIKQGKEVPYESGTQDNRNTSFREALLSLKVVPTILQNSSIRLDVKVTNDSVDENNTSDGQPLLNRQEISTNLFLEDGVTVVVGGILAKGFDETKGEVPWFSELPLIGGLFKNLDKVDRTYELLVFLTPTILENGIAPANTKKINPFDEKDVRPGAEEFGGRRVLVHPLEERDTF